MQTPLTKSRGGQWETTPEKDFTKKIAMKIIHHGNRQCSESSMALEEEEVTKI